IREQHRAFVFEQASHDAAPIAIERIQEFFPNAITLAGEGAKQETTAVLGAGGESLGYFIQTSPQSDPIVGYSGPTNTLIAFDADNHVVGIEILESRDTREHVADVARDNRFMTALVGKSWEEVAEFTKVDAVSGATLTSLAIVEGITFRLGGQKPSLKFPNEIELAEVTPFFPDAATLHARPSSATLLDVYDANDVAIGAVTRTSPTTDTSMGYQGPTDSLVAVDQADRVIGLKIRSSYDNEPYVGYVRDEAYFLERFNGLTLQELAKIDIDALGVEGVSGATMTSMAMAEGLPQAAQAALQSPPIAQRRFVFAARDVGTCLVLLAATVLSFTRLRGYRVVRLSFQLMLIGYFGFVNGDMLSQALLVGWAQSGVPWRLAPGLMLLAAASLIVPTVSKKQLYCHHICPFGAAQQLIRNRVSWKVHLPRRVLPLLEAIPATLLGIALLTANLRHRLAGNCGPGLDRRRVRADGVLSVWLSNRSCAQSAQVQCPQ
ncbi:MAG: FMN-binding protein, partial [Planctomycetia bacterium]|nr:FMN-binding protein [Planctomycetia bacterium]